jgi:succinyl-diaminopimelate desuccinylase
MVTQRASLAARKGRSMEEIIRLTGDLIRFKTTHANPGEIHRCADHIQTYLEKSGISYRRLNRNNIPSIVVAPEHRSIPVLLMSHIDVVEGPDELFEPRVEAGNLYGRGSIDDKYAVALSLVLLKEHLLRIRQQGGGPGDLPFGILITGDEEVGGANGARYALSQLKSEFCIALDGGSPERIVVKEKGILHLKLIARGQSAHGARPWLGENAIENLISDYHVLRSFFEESTPDHWHRSLNFSRIQAGQSINQVPDRAEAVFDIRYTENDDVDRLVEQIRAGIGGELQVEKKEPLFQSGQSRYLDQLLALLPGTATGFEHGASDARFLSEYGMRGIVWGAEGEMSQHTSNEHLVIESAVKLYDALDRFMRTLAGHSAR